MRSAATVATLCCLLLNIGIAQENPTPDLQPTRLEAFASQPTARLTWSKEVGRIESTEARVVVTALFVEDAVQPPHRKRGIRIDLANQNAMDQVYLEDSKLEAVKKALDRIASEVEAFRKERDSTPYRYRGAAEFWHPHQKVHTLSAAYYVAPDSSGLSLSAYKGQEFRFPGHNPSKLGAAIGRALDELKQR